MFERGLKKKKKTLFLIFINYTDYSVWAYEIWTHQSKIGFQFIHAHHGRTRKCIRSVTWFGKVRPNIAKVNPISSSKKGPMTMIVAVGPTPTSISMTGFNHVQELSLIMSIKKNDPLYFHRRCHSTGPKYFCFLERFSAERDRERKKARSWLQWLVLLNIEQQTADVSSSIYDDFQHS